MKLTETTLDLPAGSYVALSVSDTGCGMDEAIVSRIFDPFFTTKPIGKGVGLGLSISFGIMRDMGGRISLVPGEQGGEFQIDLQLAHLKFLTVVTRLSMFSSFALGGTP